MEHRRVPAADACGEHSYGPHTYSIDDVHFVLVGQRDVDIYLANFDAQRDAVGPIAFLLLDAVLGELGVMTKVGGIELLDASKQPPNARPLHELRAALGVN